MSKKIYGMPYMGSKNTIAEWVIENLPSSDVFVDLFGGGGAITHAAIESGKYKRVIYNELNPLCVDMFRKAINGEYKDEKRWISREDFKRLKDTDGYVKYCWSFSNNGKDYLYGKYIEHWKKALHYARVLNDFSLLEEMGINTDGSRLDIKNHSDEYIKKYCDYMKLNTKINIEQLQCLQSKSRLIICLENFERLNRLLTLKQNNIITVLNKDYRDVEIPDGAIVYCDIPYRDTKGYDYDFDYDAFYNWVLSSNLNIYVSEYNMPEDFKVVAEKEKRVSVCATDKNIKAIERIFKKK